jgi:hypothetical protein
VGDDKTIDPASGDDWVQTYLETRWFDAVESVERAMSNLREIWPQMTAVLPETGGNYIKRSLDNIEDAARNLHEAGPHVMGSRSYNNYIDRKTERTIEGD